MLTTYFHLVHAVSVTLCRVKILKDVFVNNFTDYNSFFDLDDWFDLLFKAFC